MATFQDTFANTDDISSQTGSEVAGGVLINEDLNAQTYLRFDGSGDYVSVGDTPIEGKSGITIGALMRINNPTTIFQRIFSKFDDSDSRVEFTTGGGGGTVVNQVELIVGTGTSNNSERAVTSIALQTNQFYWVIGRFNGASATGNKINMFVNGVNRTTQVSNFATTATPSISDTTALIGRKSDNTTSNDFNGDLAAFFIFDEAISDSEIEAISSYGTSAINLADANLVQLYNFDEGTGTTADNAEGTSSLDGTISGATWITLNDNALNNTAQQTIDISGLGYTNAFYYRMYMLGSDSSLLSSPSFEEITIEYTSAGVTIRRVVKFNRSN